MARLRPARRPRRRRAGSGRARRHPRPPCPARARSASRSCWTATSSASPTSGRCSPSSSVGRRTISAEPAAELHVAPARARRHPRAELRGRRPRRWHAAPDPPRARRHRPRRPGAGAGRRLDRAAAGALRAAPARDRGPDRPALHAAGHPPGLCAQGRDLGPPHLPRRRHGDRHGPADPRRPRAAARRLPPVPRAARRERLPALLEASREAQNAVSTKLAGRCWARSTSCCAASSRPTRAIPSTGSRPSPGATRSSSTAACSPC